MRIAAAGTVVSAGIQNNKAAESSSIFYPLIGYFRETNAEGQRILERLCNSLSLVTPDGDQALARRTFADTWRVIRNEVEEAKRRAREIDRMRDTDPETHARYARELVQIANGWDDLDHLWPSMTEGEESLDTIATRARQSVIVLKSVIFTCACQAIPTELNDYLENYRIGKCLDFVATFRDQLPDDDATRRVLAWLAPQSVVVSGLIDLENAKVIKADQRWWRQMISVAVVLVAAGLGFVLIDIAVHMGQSLQFSETAWPLSPNHWAALNGAYLLVLFGVLGHWILDRVKQNHSGSEVTPLAEWLMWIHINEVPIAVRIATVWLLILLGVAFGTFNLDKGVQPLTYFTAGYFMDSTFDALIGRFNTFVKDKDPASKKSEKNSA